VALVGCEGHVYRLRMNRCMQAEAVTDDTKSCSMPEQFRQGV
jgi:hypothetical protein